MKYTNHHCCRSITSSIILISILLLSNFIYAQYPKFDLAKRAGGTYFDDGYDIVADQNGYSYITGIFADTATFGSITLSSAGNEDVFIARYDQAGNVLWAKQAGGSYEDVAYSIAIDSSGDIVITGSFRDEATFGATTLTSSGSDDFFLAKYSSLGSLIWAISGGGTESDRGIAVTIDGSNNILVSGAFSDTATFGAITLVSSGSEDIFIAKFDASGALQWAKQAGGTGLDGAEGIIAAGSGNCFVTGSFSDTAAFNGITLVSEGAQNLFVAKYDPAGNLDWVQNAPCTESTIGKDIVIDGSTNTFVTGWFSGVVEFGSTTLTSENRDIFIAKCSATGDFVWAKKAGGDLDDLGKGIAADVNGNSYITGTVNDEADFGSFKVKTAGHADIFIAKYDPTGEILWVKTAGGSDVDGGAAVDIDPANNILITGSFGKTASFGTTSLTSAGQNDIFVARIKQLPIVADFIATPTEGIAPLEVHFTDLSWGEITGWLWNFGDGVTSTEQNPVHIYDPRVDPKFTVSLIVSGPAGADTTTKAEYISVYLPIEADFDADRTVGPAPLEVNFKNLTTGSADSFEWSFGDGSYSTEFEPTHEYAEPGSYEVKLTATGPGGKDCLYRDGFITVYADSGYLCLNFVEGSSDWWEEPWENAIDGDTWGWDGTATVEGDTAYAIFEFKNHETKKIDRFRLMSNTGVWFKQRWVKSFQVQVSTSGTEIADFYTVLDTVKQNGEWEMFKITPVNAKYVKLIINEPPAGWRQVGEFEVWEHIVLPDPTLSTIVATSPHWSTGIDPATITLTLKEETGDPISGKADGIKIYATGSDNNFSEIVETATPGVYTTTLTTMTPEIKTIWAKVQGIEIPYSNPADSTLCTVEFIEPPLVQSTLKLVDNSDDYPGEDWENAIDGDIHGWNGTVTTTGYPPYAVFKFSDDGTHQIHKIRLLTDTGVNYSSRWVTKFRLLVSTTGTNSSAFKLILEGNQTTGDWQTYYFPMTDAKYVKLVIDEPNTTWRQLGEFEVYELETPQATIASNLMKAAASEIDSDLAPDRFALLQNYPNPFNPETTIRYDLAADAKVTVAVYNIRGQLVKSLVNKTDHAGRFTVRWDATDDFGVQVSAGIYLYRITAEYDNQVFIETRRMILLR